MRASRAPDRPNVMTSLFQKRLILVCGKGGVGRSAVSGNRNNVCQGWPFYVVVRNQRQRSIRRLLRQAGRGHQRRRARAELVRVNSTAAAALEEYGLMILKFRTAYEMVFENRVTKAFLRAIPGLDDYALLGKAWFHTTEQKRGKPAWDTVVFDMPASGHSLSMLRIPKVIMETVPKALDPRCPHHQRTAFRSGNHGRRGGHVGRRNAGQRR